jgi:hypothetical protein
MKKENLLDKIINGSQTLSWAAFGIQYTIFSAHTDNVVIEFQVSQEPKYQSFSNH